MNCFFSAKTKGFYPEALMQDYESAGTLPEDIVEISGEEYETYCGMPPAGKKLGSSDGRPAWVDIPPLSQDELVAQVSTEKTARLREANTITQPWQTQLLLGMITDADKASLTTWMKYYQQVQAIDTGKAPDIEWPKKPSD